MRAALAGDPWATGLPAFVTRDDRLEAGARAFVSLTPEQRWEDITDPDDGPGALTPDDFHEVCLGVARDVLDAAYPPVRTAAEIDALPNGSVIVSELGQAMTRVSQPRSRYIWHQDPSAAYKRDGSTSEQLLQFGHTWTVVHMPGSAS